MARPLEPDNWAQLEPLVDALLDAAPEHRPALLDELSGGDLARRLELEDLVAECEKGDSLLDRSALERFSRLFDDEVTIPASLTDRYPISGELGRGGMAVVYRARDVKHGRNVAVKVIRPELAAALGRRRFLKEISIAAQLQHPHIVPLYDSGEVDGALYYVMRYESGRSLRHRLAHEGPLAISDALTVLRDVCNALGFAHGRGVVHRDIKPDNVLMSGRHAMVADFGVAKAMTESASDATALTTLGTLLGTPTYMAPEQIADSPPVDHRLDIYAIGVLGFEMLTGKPPFGGEAHEVLSAHLTEVPVAVRTVRPDVPAALSDCIARCLEKRPEDRWQSADELLQRLEGLTGIAEAAPAPTANTYLPPLVVRAASRGTGRRVAAGAIALIGVLAMGGYWIVNNAREAAVQPSTPVSEEAYTLYLKGRHFWNKRTEQDMQRAVGFFQQATNLDPGYALAWAGIADAWIFRGWYSRLAPRETFPKAKHAVLRALESDSTLAEAHASLGHIHFQFDHDWSGAEREYRRAIALDSAYATAHHWYGGLLSASGRHEEALQHAHTARRIDPLSPIIQTWVGLRHYFARQHERAIAEYRQALMLDADFAPAYWHLGMAYEQTKQYSDAIASAERAVALDADNLVFLASLGVAHAMAGQLDQARTILARLAEASRTRHVSAYHVAVIHIALGDTTAGIDWLERALEERSPWIGYLGVDPRVDPVRTHPRFQNLVGKAQLITGRSP